MKSERPSGDNGLSRRQFLNAVAGTAAICIGERVLEEGLNLEQNVPETNPLGTTVKFTGIGVVVFGVIVAGEVAKEVFSHK